MALILTFSILQHKSISKNLDSVLEVMCDKDAAARLQLVHVLEVKKIGESSYILLPTMCILLSADLQLLHHIFYGFSGPVPGEFRSQINRVHNYLSVFEPNIF